MSADELEGTLTRTHADSKRFKYLRISNQERTSGTPYDFVCDFGNDVKLDNTIEAHLHSISIPNIGNNISADIGNNNFRIQFALAGDLNIPIPDGFYSTAAIMAYLMSIINPLITPSVLSITQSPITNLITFQVTAGPDTFQMYSAASGSTLAPNLGIYADSAALLTTYTTTSIPNFYGSTYYFVHSLDLGNNLTYLVTSSSEVADVNGMWSIPVNVPYGASQTYQADAELDQIVFGKSAKSTRSFRITLRTNHGRLLTELPENLEVIMILKIFWGLYH